MGRPRASRELEDTLVPKWLALPIFSSDPISSVAYATEAAMAVLVVVSLSARATCSRSRSRSRCCS